MTPAPDRGPSEEWLLELAARAGTLDERIEGAFALVAADPQTTSRRIELWSAAVADGDEEAFEARLRLDGLSREDAALVVGRAAPIPGAEVPRWGRMIATAIADAGRLESLSDDPALDVAAPIPGQELALPFLHAARAERDRRVPSDARVGPAARRAEDRHLLTRLGSRLEGIWDRELTIARDRALGPLAEKLLRAEGTSGRELHDETAWALLRDLPALLAARPALARLLGVIALNWVDATVEFRTRLAVDRDDIAATFSGGGDPGSLVDADWGLSDPHGAGRTVVAMRFASGLGLVYKPKSLTTEAAWGRILEWLNERGFAPRLRPLRVLDRPDYGWVERAEHAPVDDVAAVARYYQRAGALLAMLRALDGSDCHNDNLIAAGEHPQLIDAETILQPAREEVAPTSPGALELARRELGEGVLGVLLLPAWHSYPGSAVATDISGLGHPDPGETDERLTWEGLGTDLARRTRRQMLPETRANAMMLGQRLVRCEDHADDLVEGFTRAYRLIEQGREELTAEAGPLSALREAPVRVVMRDTAIYAAMLRDARRPEKLHDAVEHSILFERVFRPLVGADEPEKTWPAFRSERRALQSGDVPLFQTKAGSERLETGGSDIPLVRSAMDNARAQLAALGPDDMTRQVALIRAALAIRRGPDIRPPPASGSVEAAPIDGARHIGRLLRDRAVSGPSGDLIWVGGLRNPAIERVGLQATGLDVYEGVPGIAVFLAALARVDGTGWGELARGALQTLLIALDTSSSSVIRRAGIGGSRGVGGVALALVQCAQLLDEPALLNHVRKLAESVRHEDVAADETPDLIAGSAGLALGMLALHEATGDPLALERATWAGDRLLELQAPAPGGGAAWVTMARQPMLRGIAHGAAGGALALARLASAVDDPRYAAGARDALQFERGPDLRRAHGWHEDRVPEPGGAPPRASWCRGATGVGISRIGIIRSGALPELTGALEGDLEIAADVGAREWPVVDHLCCGAAGVAEFARALGSGCPDALDRRAGTWAREVAGRLLAGDPLTLSGPPLGELPYPGLYHGLAGVGYALLGRVAPDLPLPSAWFSSPLTPDG